MNVLHITCQLVIGLGILNVWVLRAKKETPFRGGKATNLKDEFDAYGLPPSIFVMVGVLKVVAALALLAGIALPILVKPAAIVVAALMVGALVMHIRVKDAPKKSLPAGVMLLMSLVLVLT